MKKLVLVAVMFAFMASVTVAFAGAAVAPKKEPVKKEVAPASVTVTGVVAVTEVAKKKVATITGEDGADYVVAGAQLAKIVKLNGKKIKATGTVKEADGKKVLTVKTFSEVK